MVYWLLTLASAGRLLSNVAGAFAVGLVAVLFAKWKKCPVTLFSVPGLVPLVPGAPAYMAVLYRWPLHGGDADDHARRHHHGGDRAGLFAVGPVSGGAEQAD